MWPSEDERVCLQGLWNSSCEYYCDHLYSTARNTQITNFGPFFLLFRVVITNVITIIVVAPIVMGIIPMMCSVAVATT